MADPLSVLASVVGVTAFGLHVANVLTKTIQNLRSVPETISSLSRELEALCKALGYLEGILKGHDVSTEPLFPVDDLEQVLNNIMIDFKILQEIVGNHKERPDDNSLTRFWKQYRYGPQEELVSNLRRNIEGYKSTVNMTIILANMVIAKSTDGKVDDLLAQFNQLLAALRSSMGQSHAIMSSSTTPDVSSRIELSTVSRRLSLRTTMSLDPSVQATSGSTISASFNVDDNASIRSNASKRSIRSVFRPLRSKNWSRSRDTLISYPGSIIDMYCESVVSMCQDTLDGMNMSLESQTGLENVWDQLERDQLLNVEIDDVELSYNPSISDAHGTPSTRCSAEGPIQEEGSSTVTGTADSVEQGRISGIESGEPTGVLHPKPSATSEQTAGGSPCGLVSPGVEILTISRVITHEILISDINNVLRCHHSQQMPDDDMVERIIELDRNAHISGAEDDFFTWAREELLRRRSVASPSNEDDLLRLKMYVMGLDRKQAEERERQLRQWIRKRVMGQEGPLKDELKMIYSRQRELRDDALTGVLMYLSRGSPIFGVHRIALID